MPGEEKAKRKPAGAEELEAKRTSLNKMRGQYDVMKKQFENFRDSRQEEFENNLRTIIPEEDLEKIELESDPLVVYRTLKTYEQKFINDAVEEKQDELEAMEDEISQEQQMLDGYEIESKFGEENPDLDFEGMLMHLEREMSPAKKEQLLKQAEGDSLAFLSLVKDDFLGVNGDGENKGADGEEGEDLPTDISGIAGETGDLEDEGEEGVEEDYLASVGLA
jgi:hypothetical protein